MVNGEAVYVSGLNDLIVGLSDGILEASHSAAVDFAGLDAVSKGRCCDYGVVVSASNAGCLMSGDTEESNHPFPHLDCRLPFK